MRVIENLIAMFIQGRRGGEIARGGQIAPGPQVLGAPRIFLLGANHFFGWNISVQKGKIFGFFGQSTEIWYEKLR